MRKGLHASGPRAGFTMIEIALALLVVAIGLMGIFALFPAGLNASRAAMDDSRVAMLAESVFADLRMELDENFSSVGTYAFRLGTNVALGAGSDVKLYDPSGGEPIARCKLTVSQITPNRLIEAQLECWPGLQTQRKKVFYTRIANREGI